MKKLILVMIFTLVAMTSWATTYFIVWAGESLTIAWDYNVVPEPDLDGFLIYCQVPGEDEVLAANVTDETARVFTFDSGPCRDGNNTFSMSAYDDSGLEGERSIDVVVRDLNNPPNGIPGNLRFE